jgi:hypothetical protein
MLECVRGVHCLVISAGPVHEQFGAPGASLQAGESFGQVAGVRCCGGADEEQPAGAAGGSHGGDRPDRQAGGEISQAAVCQLLDGGGAVGMVVGDDGLAALGEAVSSLR